MDNYSHLVHKVQLHNSPLGAKYNSAKNRSKHHALETLEKRLLLSGSDIYDSSLRLEFENDFVSTATSFTNQGGADFLGDAAQFTASRIGLGKSLLFDGQDDYVDLSSLTDDVEGAFTVSFWVKTNQASQEQTLLSVTDVDGTNVFRIYLDISGRLNTSRGDNNTFFSTGVGIADGQWHHVTFSREEPSSLGQANASLSIDGDFKKSYNAGGWELNSEMTWSLGRHLLNNASASMLTGTLDDVRVYDRELNVVEQETVYANAIKRGEQEYLLGRVPLSAATHQTVASGNWDDPTIWQNGILPSDGANVVIGEADRVRFNLEISPRLRTLRVDGELTFKTDFDTQLVVDLLAVTRTGTLQIGSQETPLASDTQSRITFAPVDPEKPEIDLKWDPMRISRGLASLGAVDIWGAEKTPYAVLTGNHGAFIETLTLHEIPVDWQVGDTLVVTGTDYQSSGKHAVNSVFQDEVVVITSIDQENKQIAFSHQDEPGRTSLRFDHGAPDRLDSEGNPFPVYVANMTRNIVLETEGWQDFSENIATRGHTMFMHTRDVSINQAGFYGLGRSDKSQVVNDPVINQNGLLDSSGLNRRGRYSVHFHKNGADDVADLSAVEFRGNSVWDSPGWGVVVHDSRAVVEDNVSFDVVGAHFVTEDGNEIAEFRRNLAIKSSGGTINNQAPHEREADHDRAFAGHGFWLESSFSARAFEDNIAVSHANAGIFVWGRLDNEDFLVDVPVGNLLPEDVVIAGDEETVKAWKVPLRQFKDNTTYNSYGALEIAGHVRDDTGADYHSTNHSIQGTVDNLTGWGLYGYGVGVVYASKIQINNATLLGDLENPIPLGNRAEFDVIEGFGVFQMKNTRFVELVNPHIEGFHYGATLGQTGGQALMTYDEVPIGMTVIDGGYFANNNYHLASADGREANDPSDPLVLDSPPFSFWSIVKGDPYYDTSANTTNLLAEFTYYDLGGTAIAFDASDSQDLDYTPGWSGLDANTVAFFEWDFDNDGDADAWGRTVDHVFENAGEFEVALTITDSKGRQATKKQSVIVSDLSYGNLLPASDSQFDNPTLVDTDQDGRSVGHLGQGWWQQQWSWKAEHGSLSKVQDGSRPYAHYISPNYKTYRDEVFLSFDYTNLNGDSKANDFQVRVFGINGDNFRIGDWSTPYTTNNSHPADITEIYQSGNLGEVDSSGTTHQARINLGEGYDYLIISIEGSSQIKPSQGDVVSIDNLQIRGDSSNLAVPYVTLSTSTPEIIEGSSSGYFEISRSGILDQPLTVTYELGGTIDAADYSELLDGTVTIPAGESNVTLPITLLLDGLSEGDEELVISLTEDRAYRTNSQSRAEIIVSDPYVKTPKLQAHLPLLDSFEETAGGLSTQVIGDPELLAEGTLQLDGEGDQLVLPAEAITDVEEELTLAMWIKPEKFGGYQTLFDTKGRQLSLWIDSANSGWYGVGGVSNRINFAESFTLDEWQHIALIVAEGEAKLYRNGVLIATVQAGAINAAELAIGGNPSGGGSNYQGQIRDVRIYNYGHKHMQLAG